MARFVLVHGAWHGAWCWSKLVPLLARRGHQVSAIDLPGLGEDQTPPSQISVSSYGDAVARAVRAAPTPAILVGHSMGGLAITDGAEKAPEAIAKLIYLTAFLPGNGDSLQSLQGLDANAAAQQAFILDEAGGTMSLAPDRVADLFYHDCSPADIEDAARRLRPQALRPLDDALRITAERFGRIPRAYIECTEDRAITIAMQRAMIARAMPIQVASLKASHSPFLSMPEDLADLLDQLTRNG